MAPDAWNEDDPLAPTSDSFSADFSGGDQPHKSSSHKAFARGAAVIFLVIAAVVGMVGESGVGPIAGFGICWVLYVMAAVNGVRATKRGRSRQQAIVGNAYCWLVLACAIWLGWMAATALVAV